MSGASQLAKVAGVITHSTDAFTLELDDGRTLECKHGIKAALASHFDDDGWTILTYEWTSPHAECVAVPPQLLPILLPYFQVPMPRLIGATLTDTAITFHLKGYTPLRVPRDITGVWFGGFDPNTPLPRMRVLTISVARPEGLQMHEVQVDTQSEEGRAALAALGLPGYTPLEGFRPASEHLNAAD